MVSISTQDLVKSFMPEPAAQSSSWGCRKTCIITLIGVAILSAAVSVAFGITAIVTEVHWLWIGCVGCALITIIALGLILCSIPNGYRNNRTFNRPTPKVHRKIYLEDDYYGRGSRVRPLSRGIPNGVNMWDASKATA